MSHPRCNLSILPTGTKMVLPKIKIAEFSTYIFFYLLSHWINLDSIGLKSHPQHELAKKQMKGFSGMVTVYIKGNLENSRTFLQSLKVRVQPLSVYNMVLTTPWIPGKLLEFWNFLPGPWKTPEKQIISLNSWKTRGILKFSSRALENRYNSLYTWKTSGISFSPVS